MQKIGVVETLRLKWMLPQGWLKRRGAESKIIMTYSVRGHSVMHELREEDLVRTLRAPSVPCSYTRS